MITNNLSYPTDPYAPPITGIFHNQTPRNTSLAGRYTVYIPNNFEHCSQAILILPDNQMTAQGFFESTDGQAWKSTADINGIVIVVAESYQNAGWNLTNAINMRDDEEFLYGVVDTIRQKYSTIPAAFNLDERSLYLVGYNSGGIAAHKMAMHWPQLFGGLISINGSDVPSSVISAFGNTFSYPFIAGQNSDGRETIGLNNKDIPLPVWMISTTSIPNNVAVKNYWVAADNAIEDEPNEYAQTTYINGATRIWLTTGATIPTPTVLFENFLNEALRYTNTPGGKLEWRVKTENVSGKGFIYTEATIDGKLRRWYTYVPSTYNDANEYPLIVAMHGGSNSAEAFIGDSRWHEAAEEYGLLVVFPQAYPCPLPSFGWIPVPVWNQYIVSPSSPPDDVAFIREVITRTSQNYNVNAKKIFATGHSNGAGMTWRLGLDAPELFAAIAPAGWTISAIPGESPVPSLTSPLPVWLFMGRYDQVGADEFKNGNSNDMCLKYWANRNGFDYTKLTTEYDQSGNYYSRVWTNGTDNIPLFKFTSVTECPHIYVPYECELLWEQFFSKITLETNGKRYFDGQEIVNGNN
ncbi:hypothetical protein GOQ29_04580 [Clostridium sp. D2Q-14]|uniref:PHB depolymerase family esterase n=1 Tax=Anaeromonas gelatinilytica TaxID=2683194 RepID=UPI00193B08CA|nr:PHB depolymerase family esterase [Anaeromonas gelatinilytica]MBS4534890.1 hypothetical protein [Anaeromonas gelatinilytica]